MAAWRRKAIENFPHLRRWLTHADPDTRMTFNWLCYELKDMVEKEPYRSDSEMLRSVFAYAEWCGRQRAEVIWNTIALAFYEHLFDRREDWDTVIPSLAPEIICVYWNLWERRPTLGWRDLAELRRKLDYDRFCDERGRVRR